MRTPYLTWRKRYIFNVNAVGELFPFLRSLAAPILSSLFPTKNTYFNLLHFVSFTLAQLGDSIVLNHEYEAQIAALQLVVAERDQLLIALEEAGAEKDRLNGMI